MSDEPLRNGNDGKNGSNENHKSQSSFRSHLPTPRTSKETEIKLTNVGRASLEELLADYCDYLRVRDKTIWDKDSKEAMYV
jgi:hypothetical protein